MSKGWWFDRYSYDHRDYSYEKGSGSRGWMSKLGSWYDDDDWYRPSKKDANQTYQRMLNQLQNSANLLGNDDQGGAIRVSWSNGQNVNQPGSSDRTIYLSPDGLIDPSNNEISEEKLDAMTGKVYLASMLRETVDPVAFAQAQVGRSNKKSAPIVKLWEAVETSIARSQLLEDWAGFAPYIAEDGRQSSATKEEVQRYIDTSVIQPNVESAITAIAWNLLNANDPVVVPDVYDECVEVASEVLAEEVDASDRYRACHEITERIRKILKETHTSEGEGDGDPDSTCSGDDDGGKSKGKGKPKPSSGGGAGEKSPELCDGDMLGDIVENKIDASLSEQKAESESEVGSGGNIDVLTADSRMDQNGKKFIFVPVDANKENHDEYRHIVANNRSAIQLVRSSLAFRNTDTSMVSFGHRRGDIDDNSLFKVRMGDDRVMSVRDTVSEKKIAVCLLVDESGSMGNGAGSKSAMARDVAIILAEGLKGVRGITVNVYGHSAELTTKKGHCSGAVMFEYVSPRKSDLASCMQIHGRGENHDGFAIQHTANQFLRDHADATRKIMFVISDGQPAGSHYGGRLAIQHVLGVSDACRSRGLEVYGIGVLKAFSVDLANMLYGKDKCVVLSDVKSSIGVMTRFLRQVASKM